MGNIQLECSSSRIYTIYSNCPMQIYIASDHGGFELKKVFIEYLESKGHSVTDFGPAILDPKDDYPSFVIPAVKNLLKNPQARAIVICRNGVGVSVLANKFGDVRCALSWDENHIKTAREDDDVNVLAIPADFVTGPKAKKIVDVFLETNFSKAKRHIRRLRQIKILEL